jgi:hypothetical protein
MTPSKSLTAATLTLLLAMILVLGGCSEDKCTFVKCCVPDPTLANIWPSEDGTWWTYEYESRFLESIALTVYENEDDVPPAPSMDEIETLLDTVRPADTGEAGVGIYSLVFDGVTTTGPGVTAQNLVESLSEVGGDNLGLSGGSAGDPLLGRLAIARPDIAAAMVSDEVAGSIVRRISVRPDLTKAGSACQVLGVTGTQLLTEPLLVHGGAWEKTTEWIGTYGDVDTLLAWKFLEADLSPGHGFRHQLLPSVAGDVFLDLRILRQGAFRTNQGTFVKTLECLYRIDYGILEVLDMDPPGKGYVRAFGYGVVVYAPTFGPVYCHERPIVDAGVPTNIGVGHLTVDLVATSLLPDEASAAWR